MMGRVVLPMEEMAARAGASDLDDPLAHVRACALNVLYLDQLRAAPHKRAPGSGAVRKAVLGTVQSD